ncbi:hypothetical protein Ga0466249_003380 [Sporomusaceae bacterium BoRhaA]|uniref:DUF2971 domain-containing protein n=1 Tax=Pelorhabdus rhamnosifermentans TaxID=2772457 RepID=UPI001C06195D|nr:DUF2971 domain-containing protein [Pelorhabdus rhamnosifermentans]MBU2702253.1 hypothetical protein [Pelorhabdus rhamnosifermentans]
MKLYKYTTWRPLEKGCDLKKDCVLVQKCHTKENLLNSKLFFNSPKQFNDPFDTLPIVITEHTEKELKKFGIKVFMEQYKQPKKLAMKNFKEILKTDKRYKSKKTFQKMIINTFLTSRRETGVTCFSQNSPEKLLMWGYYGDKDTGVCLEFNFPNNKPDFSLLSGNQNIKIGGPFPIKYGNELPIYHFLNIGQEELYNSLTSKCKEWKLENEYRIICYRYVGPLVYPASYLRAIYAGCKMNDTNFEELRKTIKKMKFEPLLYRTKINKEQYKLDLIKV